MGSSGAVDDNPTNQTSTGAINYETLHWDGDTLLFTTDSSGRLDDLKMGKAADYTPLQSYAGLTFWDRDTDGAVIGCHNSTGVSLVSPSSNCQSSGSFIGPVVAQNNWGAGVPRGGAIITAIAGQTVGQGAIIWEPHIDGYSDGYNTFQGDRSYDSQAGTWTVPDAYGGEIDDPASQKSYIWNRNNRLSYSDPNGFDVMDFADATDEDQSSYDMAIAVGAFTPGFTHHDGQGSPNQLTMLIANIVNWALETIHANSDVAKMLRAQNVTVMELIFYALQKCLGNTMHIDVKGGEIHVWNKVGNSARVIGDDTGVEISDSIGGHMNDENILLQYDARLELILRSDNVHGHYWFSGKFQETPEECMPHLDWDVKDTLKNFQPGKTSEIVERWIDAGGLDDHEIP